MASRKKKETKELPPYVVEKRGEWHVRIAFPTRQRDKNNRIIYEQMSRKCEPQTADRAAEIVEFLREQKKQLKAPHPNNSTLLEYLRRYVKARKANVSSATYGYYSYLIESHFADSLVGSMQIREVSTLDLQDHYDNLSANGASPSRIKKIDVVVSMALRQAVVWEVIAKNPCEGLIVPKVRRIESPALSKAEARKLVKACSENDQYIIFAFALETGLRPQETLALRWSDVDWKNKKIRVRQALIKDFDKTNVRVGPVKSNASKRTIGLSLNLYNNLLRQKEIISEWQSSLTKTIERPILLKHKKAKGALYKRRQVTNKTAREILERMKEFDLVFPGQHGGLKSEKNVSQRDFKAALVAADLDPKKYSFKHLRHTCATFLASFLNPKQLQKHLGHASLTTTMTYYVHLDDETEFEGSEAMSGVLY